MNDKKWPLTRDWTGYAVCWALLLSNIINDWLTRQWISPLSILILVTLAGMTLYQHWRGDLMMKLDEGTLRFLFAFVFVLAFMMITLWRVVWGILG